MPRFRAAISGLCASVALAPSLARAGADPSENFPTRLLQVRYVEANVHVDGKLDELVWSQIQPTGDFIQMEPDEGKPATEKTEVYIFYNKEKLYFGFKCYDSEPKKIIARYDAHDARTFSDSVNIFLDPFGDRRTGYFFSINARGVQFDALHSEASGLDGSWDGIWESATRLESWGWSAEVAIPFKSIRFKPGQVWGINLGRDIVRKNENDNWQFVTRFDKFMRPSKAGLLEGISGVEPGRNVELIPYVSSRVRRKALDPAQNGEKYEGGDDVRWGLRPNLTLNATINPDFAETEADEFNITLSRFELFFPEKRTFFTEGANFYVTPLQLFFTRRVGSRLPDGNPQRILFGGKLTGKVNGWSLGMLEARTEDTHFTDPTTGLRPFAPGANFFVLRIEKDIWKNSAVGFITVNRDQGPGDFGATERVHALDLNIVAGPHLKWATQAAYNQTDTTPGGIHRAGFITDAVHNSELWQWEAGYKYLGRGFDVSQIGFEPETDRHVGVVNFTYKPFYNRYYIRQVFYGLNYDSSSDTEGRLQDSGADADLTVQLKNFWSLNAHYGYDRVRFNRFTPNFQALSDTRVYIEPRIRLSLDTNQNRPVFLDYSFTWRKFVQFKENFYGRDQDHTLSLNARVFGHTRFQFTGRIFREFLLDGRAFQVRRLFVTRLNEQFTPKWRMRVLAQLTNNRHGRDISINSILAYDFTARSAFIMGYNHQKLTHALASDPPPRANLGNEFFVKLSYLFHF